MIRWCVFMICVFSMCVSSVAILMVGSHDKKFPAEYRLAEQEYRNIDNVFDYAFTTVWVYSFCWFSDRRFRQNECWARAFLYWVQMRSWWDMKRLISVVCAVFVAMVNWLNNPSVSQGCENVWLWRVFVTKSECVRKCLIGTCFCHEIRMCVKMFDWDVFLSRNPNVCENVWLGRVFVTKSECVRKCLIVTK